jgi:hypothetical protein
MKIVVKVALIRNWLGSREHWGLESERERAQANVRCNLNALSAGAPSANRPSRSGAPTCGIHDRAMRGWAGLSRLHFRDGNI